MLDLPPAATRRRDRATGARLPNDERARPLYHPWIAVRDPLRGRAACVRFVPPSGHVAGMFARTDRLRGVHKPPANEVLEGVCDVREPLDDAVHGGLNDAGSTPSAPSPAAACWCSAPARSSPDYRWRYVNVRRLFTMIEEALDEQMQWAVFEPNNPQLWRDIDRAVRGFLERLCRAGHARRRDLRGGLLGALRRDHQSAVRAPTTGRVTCVIGVQPPYPAEFVVVRIGVTRSGIQVEEKGAQDV